jgi:hypothetical protein
LTFFSLVYHHPAIDKINLNVHNPRTDWDLAENGSIHTSTVYATNNCITADQNCAVCTVPESSFQAFCLKCKSGWSYFNGGCNAKSRTTNDVSISVNNSAAGSGTITISTDGKGGAKP